MNIKTPSRNETVANLQVVTSKSCITKWLAANPDLLILDEPTRGEMLAKAEIYNIMNELAKQGISIIMISSEMPKLLI